MARRLRRPVHVRDSMGVPHVFGPTDDVPAWAAAKIGNPAAWTDDPNPDPPRRAPARTEVQNPARTPAPVAAPAVQDGPPPQTGRGSSLAAWRAWAELHDLVVPEGADRGDIIAACRAAGVPVG